VTLNYCSQIAKEESTSTIPAMV